MAGGENVEQKWLMRCPRCRKEFIRKPPAVGTWYRCPKCADPQGGGADLGGYYMTGGTVHLQAVRLAQAADYKRLRVKPEPMSEPVPKPWALHRCKGCGYELAAEPGEARLVCPVCGESLRPVRQARPEEIEAARGK